MSRHGDPAVRAKMRNVHSARTPLNRFLVGTPSMQNDVKSFHAARAPRRRKGDETQYAHILLLASPEYFQNGNKPGEIVSSKLENWVKASMEWAEKEFGDTLVHARLDLDEATPHIDLAVVPTYLKTTKRGKTTEWLSFRQVFGVVTDPKSKFSYEEWQDKYADAVAPLGLKRGERGSKTRHISPALFRSKKQILDIAEIEAKKAFENRDLLEANLSEDGKPALIFSKFTPPKNISRLTALFTPVWRPIWNKVDQWSKQRQLYLTQLRDDATAAAAMRMGANTLLRRDQHAIERGTPTTQPTLPPTVKSKGLER